MRNFEVVAFPYGVLRPSDYVTNHTIGTTSKAITPPSTGPAVAVFSCETNFWARFGSSDVAVIPSTTADVTDGSGCVLNPTMRYVFGTTQINVISPTTGRLSIEWFKHP